MAGKTVRPYSASLHTLSHVQHALDCNGWQGSQPWTRSTAFKFFFSFQAPWLAEMPLYCLSTVLLFYKLMSSIERPCDKVTRHSESNTERRILGMSKEGRGYAMGDRRIFFFKCMFLKNKNFYEHLNGTSTEEWMDLHKPLERSEGLEFKTHTSRHIWPFIYIHRKILVSQQYNF